jgi:hypothetical protein
MDEFKVIMVMNEAMIELLKDKKRNYDNNKRIAEYSYNRAISGGKQLCAQPDRSRIK